MQTKKLLVTGSTFPRWEGDTEPRFILDYAKAMTEYYEVHALVPMAPGAKEEEVMEGVTVHRYHYFPIHKWETLCYPGAIVPRIKEKKIRIFLVPFLLLSLKAQLKKYAKTVDLVHSHWIIPQGIMQASIKTVPYIITGHGGDVTSLNVGPMKGLKKKTLRNAAATIGVSGYICKKMDELCPGTRATMISMGCDTDKFSPENKNDKYFSHDKKNIVFVGRLAEKKGVTYLIEAMKDVDAKLYIIGKGPLEDSLKAQTKELGLEEKITFVGPKSHDELPEILASADVFAAPSIVAKDGDQEGLPVSIMEAMASGLPVVSGISGGTSDIVEDGVNGYILDATNVPELADRLRKIISDDALSKRMSEAALETSKRFSYKSIAAMHYELINSRI
ncbi:MAG: glycosyltransferase family 4 protein [Lachnospiraceae bacterium]|nr:glycosyltransferase family 4 protein [Lachnospiraceae bacterium]